MNKWLIGFLTATPLVLWAIIVLGGMAMEAIFKGDKNQPWRSKLLNIGNGLVLCVFTFLMAPLTGLFAYESSRSIEGFINLQFFSAYNALWQIACGLLYIAAADFLYYFWHRAQHTIPVLWDIHAVHHSEMSFNVTSYLRHHWLEVPVQTVLIALPINLLFQFEPLTAGAAQIIVSFLVFFSHMNIRLELGRCSWVVTGPQIHRLHHSVLPRHRNTNYAQFLPIFDVLFGTYVAPAPREFPPTGLPGDTRMENLSDLTLWPFKQWMRRLKRKTDSSALLP
ncbi:MAG: sterol desaturase family protein [Alphaproteobacteria bacterium]|nr:sterol desaturase family protein [Alphaproteobacteria bacterium]